jgi:general secretion pathway protein A
VRRTGIIVLNGAIGTGKTTLLHAAMQVLLRMKENNSSLASAFVLNPLLSRDEFLETLMAEFEVTCASTSKPARLAALHKMFLERQRLGGTSVLIVDEAHLLTMELLEEIRLLSNTDSYREKLLQVILCGQPELMTLLQRRELRALQQRVTQYCSLSPLNLAETRSYIKERLHAAGLRGKSPFTSKPTELIHVNSKGVPRLINQICDTSLVLGFHAKSLEIMPDMIVEAVLQLQLNREDAEGYQEPVGADDGMKAAKTVVDLLIEAMKHRRASALE